MRFEYEGMSLWYGTPDAAAQSVQAGTEIAITIGVSPVDASNKVELLYRVNHGPTEMVATKWVQNDHSGKGQYFRARLPAFRAGDTVEYIPICRCAGRQVPSPDEARQFASSIRVTDAQAKSAPSLAKREVPLLRIGDSGDEVARLHERLELHPALSIAATPRPAMESPTLRLASGRIKSMKPTAVVAQMVKSGETPLAAPAAVQEQQARAAVINIAASLNHQDSPDRRGGNTIMVTPLQPEGEPPDEEPPDEEPPVEFPDVTPPTLFINPPATVTTPAPPYTATIKGTATDDDTGVAAVEWRLGTSGSFQAADLLIEPVMGMTRDWSDTVTLPGLGAHTVTVRARDHAANVSPTQTVTINVIDTTPPALGITSPQEGETFTLVANSVPVEVRGTASDTQTGVALVEWALDSQSQFTPAIPKAASDWSSWSALIPIATAGNHTITIRAKDKVTPTGI
jgi:Big-like domain-containing protein